MHLVLCAVNTRFTRLGDDMNPCQAGTSKFAIRYSQDKALLSCSCIRTCYEELSYGLCSKYQVAMHQPLPSRTILTQMSSIQTEISFVQNVRHSKRPSITSY